MADDLSSPRPSPMEMFILSSDHLLGSKNVDQLIPPDSGWSLRPTRDEDGGGLLSTSTAWAVAAAIAGGGRSIQRARQAERSALIGLLKRGVPPCLRCAVWVTNTHWAISPETPKHEIDEFGTLKQVQVFEHGWTVVLRQLFPDESDEENAHMIDFGLGDRQIVNLLLTGGKDGAPIPEKGAEALRRVLVAARMSLGIEYCAMLPDICALFLSVMDEAYAYSTLRTMLEDSSHFFPLSRVEHVAFCHTFFQILERLYPQTYDVMKAIGMLRPAALDPIFKRFFSTVLRSEHVKRIMDLFTLEGVDVIFRFGTSLLCLYHAHMSSQSELSCSSAHAWWDGVRNFAHSRRFKFDVFLINQVYGFSSGRIRKRSIFPRHDVVVRMIEKNEEAATLGLLDLSDDDPVAYQHNDQMLGFVETPEVPICLAKHAADRQHLAAFLPKTLSSTKLDIIYSTNVHGRTVERFYYHCALAKARHTVTLCEVLGKDIIVGFFATDTWRDSKEGYGDGGCFLFRLRPNPICFKWNNLANSESSQQLLVDTVSSQPLSTGRNQRYFADQIMVSGSSYLGMGMGDDGASGLRLNEDLTKGSTSPAMGIGAGKQSLLGDDSQVFDVGLVECYRFVREVDGVEVDGAVRKVEGLPST